MPQNGLLTEQEAAKETPKDRRDRMEHNAKFFDWQKQNNIRREKKRLEKVGQWESDLKERYERVVREQFPVTEHTELFSKRTFFGGWPVFSDGKKKR